MAKYCGPFLDKPSNCARSGWFSVYQTHFNVKKSGVPDLSTYLSAYFICFGIFCF
jgi:hypothetical protein